MNTPADPGAIFDWDGVIIDSSATHAESWRLLAGEEGLALPADHFKKGFGRKNQFIIPEILGWTRDPAEIERLGHRKEDLYRELVLARGIEPLPGVRDLLDGLRAAGVPCVVGSSTPRINIETVLGLIHLGEYFAAIVSAEDVSHGKPDPEVFLKAAAKIARAPARCVVFEDALVGLEAARAGGMKCIGVGTTNQVEILRPHCDRAVFRLTEVSAAEVVAMLGNKPELHLIRKNDPDLPQIEPISRGATIYRSGNWLISEDKAHALIAGGIYFHRKQAEPSFFGGKIIAFEKTTDGRVIFIFEYDESCRGVKTASEGWSQEMKIVL